MAVCQRLAVAVVIGRLGKGKTERASQGTRGQGRGRSRVHPCTVLRGEPAVT